MGKKLQEIPIGQWSDKFRNLYLKQDMNRKPEDFWIAVEDHLSQLGESIRRMNYPLAFKCATHVFAWMCEFINSCNSGNIFLEFKTDLNLSEIVALKYPDVCGHCLKAPCKCKADKIESKDNKSVRYQKLFERWIKYDHIFKNRSTADWLTKFRYIFSNNIRLQDMNTMGFHLLEEGGEESRAVRELTQFRDLSRLHPNIISNSELEDFKDFKKLRPEYENMKNKKEGLLDKLGITDLDERRKELRRNPDPIFLRYRILSAKMDLLFEFADTFSWLTTLLLKIKMLLEPMHESKWLINMYENDFLEIELAHKYGLDFQFPNAPLYCPSCKLSLCDCKYFIKK